MSWTDSGQEDCCGTCGHPRWIHGLHVGKTVTQPCRQGNCPPYDVTCECIDFKRSYGGQNDEGDD